MTRNLALDEMRGLAVLMMIAFHFIYDLNYFGLTTIDLFKDTFYVFWRYLIVILFLNAVGITLVLKHKNSTFKYFIKRLTKLIIVVILISIATYLVVPERWIYFGILHLILISSLLSFFFIKHPNIALTSAIIILVLGVFNLPDLSSLKNTLALFLPKNTLDFYSLFPWLAMVLTGIYLGYHPWYQKVFITKFKILQFLGKNALVIYLSHQLILFSLVYLISL
jgi:uncharacterized membrane protein